MWHNIVLKLFCETINIYWSALFCIRCATDFLKLMHESRYPRWDSPPTHRQQMCLKVFHLASSCCSRQRHMALATVLYHTCWLCGPLEHPVAPPVATDTCVLAAEPCPWGVIQFQIATPECACLCSSWVSPDTSAELGSVVWRAKTETHQFLGGICGP